MHFGRAYFFRNSMAKMDMTSPPSDLEIRIMISHEQKSALETAAMNAGLSFSAFVRRLLFEDVVLPETAHHDELSAWLAAPPKRIKELEQLAKYGVNPGEKS